MSEIKEKPILDKNFNENLDIKKCISEGSILSRLFIEVQGNDVEAAKKALERTIFFSLAKEKGISLLNVKLYNIQHDKETNVFSGVAEIKLIFRDFRWFVNIAMRYGPSAIEIIQPEEYKLNLEEMQSILADVSEISQSFSSQIYAMLKDDERRQLYKKILGQK